ncbi:MAG: Gamma-glutamyl phosphate reductase, partial [Actinomycetota bacterium]
MSDGFQRILDDARLASIVLARTSTTDKNAALEAIAAAIDANSERIVTANSSDYARSEADGMEAGLLDRLRLTPERVAGLASAVRDLI